MEEWRSRVVEVLRGVVETYGGVLVGLIGLVILGIGGFFSNYVAQRIAWFGLAWVFLAAAFFLLSRRTELPPLGHPRARTILILLGLIFLVSLYLRVLPLGKTPYPIGYDYGFYEASMQYYEEAGPEVPFTTAPPWIQLQFEPGLLILHQTLHEVSGINAFDHLDLLWPVLSALLVLPVYAVTRNHFGAGAGLVAAGFAGVAFTPYAVYQFLYEKNTLALYLLLILFIAGHRRRFVLAGLLLGALGMWHRPTFLLAAAALVPTAIVHMREWKGWAKTAAVSLPVFLPVWLQLPRQYFDLAYQVFQSAEANIGLAVTEDQTTGGGTFFSFIRYQNVAITYLPLALAGTVLLLRRKNAVLPAFAFALAFINVWLQLVFFKRFIIMLDLVSLVLVAAAYINVSPPKPKWVRPAIAVALLVLTAIPTSIEAHRTPHPPFSWVNEEQADALSKLRDLVPENGSILASNIISPYVAAESDRRTFGPGLFDDPHIGSEWRAFFIERDAEDIRQFLSVYPRPLFLVHVEGEGDGLGPSKFDVPPFSSVLNERGVRVWRYDG